MGSGEGGIVTGCVEGYSDYYVFLKKIIGVHRYIGVKNNSQALL
jgi:hypothetical protein